MRFEPSTSYSAVEVMDRDPELYAKLERDWKLQPGAWGVTSSVRQASDALFDDGHCLGKVLNAAAK
jgi:hypothetical protein